MSHLGDATEAQGVLPARGRAVLVQEGRVREYAAVDERAVALAQRHLGADETQDVGVPGELAEGGTDTKRAWSSPAVATRSKLLRFSSKSI